MCERKERVRERERKIFSIEVGWMGFRSENGKKTGGIGGRTYSLDEGSTL